MVLSGSSISPDSLARHQLLQQETVEALPASSPLGADSHNMGTLKLCNAEQGPDWAEAAIVDSLELTRWCEKEVCAFRTTLVCYSNSTGRKMTTLSSNIMKLTQLSLTGLTFRLMTLRMFVLGNSL